MKASVLVAAATLGLSCACPSTPPADQLSVTGTLERDGVEETNLAGVDIDYTSKSAKGEWWSCELRMTAGGCVGEHHVNVWVTMPGVVDFDSIGGVGCLNEQGEPFGAYELLFTNTKNGDPIVIGQDANVLVLVASDVDGNRFANLEDDGETTAASLLVDGTIEVNGIGEFDAPVSLTIDGTTSDGNAVHVEMDGPTSAVANPGPLDVARTCVPDDLVK